MDIIDDVERFKVLVVEVEERDATGYSSCLVDTTDITEDDWRARGLARFAFVPTASRHCCAVSEGLEKALAVSTDDDRLTVGKSMLPI